MKKEAPSFDLEFKKGRVPEEGTAVIAIDSSKKATYLGVISTTPYSAVDKSRNYQTLYRYIVNGKEVVDTMNKTKVQRYVWRNINITEQGILAKTSKGEIVKYPDLPPRPGKRTRTQTLAQAVQIHVTDSKAKSRFSSATAIEKGVVTQLATGERFNSYGLIKIDLLEVPSERILNLSTKQEAERWGIHTGKGGISERVTREVDHTREILIDGGIPGKAIVEYRPS
jgi:hypothetical protein